MGVREKDRETDAEDRVVWREAVGAGGPDAVRSTVSGEQADWTRESCLVVAVVAVYGWFALSRALAMRNTAMGAGWVAIDVAWLWVSAGGAWRR